MAPLGRKQALADPAAWRAAMARARESVSDAQLDELLDQAVERLRAEMNAGKRIAYAWSGGKDSQALRYVMEQAGLHSCVLAMTTGLEWPAMLAWQTDHLPVGCDVIAVDLDLPWLARHPRMLFPQGSDGPRWFSLVQHRVQRDYFRRERLDLLALGRRRSDGNFVGRNGADRYTNRHGVTYWSPLADWSHEAVFALIAREPGAAALLRLAPRIPGRYRAVARPAMDELGRPWVRRMLDHRPRRDPCGCRRASPSSRLDAPQRQAIGSALVCGIFAYHGAAAPDPNRLVEVAAAAGTRGPHGYGWATRQPNGDLERQYGRGGITTALDGVRAITSPIVLGHTRLATGGDWRDPEGLQPVVVGSYALAHNGHVHDQSRLVHAPGSGDVTDSSALATTYAALRGRGLNPFDALTELVARAAQVAWAIVVLDSDGSLYAHRHYHPLHTVHADHGVYLSSRPTAGSRPIPANTAIRIDSPALEVRGAGEDPPQTTGRP